MTSAVPPPLSRSALSICLRRVQSGPDRASWPSSRFLPTCLPLPLRRRPAGPGAEPGGTATITVRARDSDGNQVSDTFDVTVVARPEPQAEAPASEPEQEQDVVARYDANGDGVISRSEYYAAVADLSKGLAMSDLLRVRQAWVDGGYKQ